MYLQITNRCNMTCAHCCMSSGPRAHPKSMDMNHEIFLAGLNVAKEMGYHITIGGGEPTLHAHFFDFLDKTIAMDFYRSEGIQPLVVTNGKRTASIRRLIDKYLEREVPICVDLSTDSYHDPIEPWVREYFTRQQERQRQMRYSYDPVESPAIAGTRGNSDRMVLAVGRGADITGAKAGCCCEATLVDIHGDVYSCGCKHTKIGNVLTDTGFISWFRSDFAHQGGRDPEEETEAELQ